MKKTIRILGVFFILALCGTILFYWHTVQNKVKVKRSAKYYKQLRAQMYALQNDGNLDYLSFEEKIKNLPHSRHSWLKEFWYSITFVDPRGPIVFYQDAMMGLALSIHRLWKSQYTTLTTNEVVDDVFKRRKHVWHDWPWENHYSREYAMLGALAYVTQSDSFAKYQKRLRESLEQIYLVDGSSHEGIAYGIYNIHLLAPYVYITKDTVVERYISDFYRWLSQIADADGWLPPFDDSKINKWPPTITQFVNVAKAFRTHTDFTVNDNDYFGPNESVFKRAQHTLWVRHKQQLSGKTYHQHFSQGDIFWKSKRNWWLISGGYGGNTASHYPYLHNIATVGGRRFDDLSWRVMSLFGKDYQTVIEKITGNHLALRLPDEIKRTIDLQEDRIKIRDEYKNESMHIYWHFLGDIKKQEESDKVLSLVFEQNGEIVTAIFHGYESYTIDTAPHHLFKKRQGEHTYIRLKGSWVDSEFILGEVETMKIAESPDPSKDGSVEVLTGRAIYQSGEEIDILVENRFLKSIAYFQHHGWGSLVIEKEIEPEIFQELEIAYDVNFQKYLRKLEPKTQVKLFWDQAFIENQNILHRIGGKKQRYRIKFIYWKKCDASIGSVPDLECQENAVYSKPFVIN